MLRRRPASGYQRKCDFHLAVAPEVLDLVGQAAPSNDKASKKATPSKKAPKAKTAPCGYFGIGPLPVVPPRGGLRCSPGAFTRGVSGIAPAASLLCGKYR